MRETNPRNYYYYYRKKIKKKRKNEEHKEYRKKEPKEGTEEFGGWTQRVWVPQTQNQQWPSQIPFPRNTTALHMARSPLPPPRINHESIIRTLQRAWHNHICQTKFPTHPPQKKRKSTFFISIGHVSITVLVMSMPCCQCHVLTCIPPYGYVSTSWEHWTETNAPTKGTGAGNIDIDGYVSFEKRTI